MSKETKEKKRGMTMHSSAIRAGHTPDWTDPLDGSKMVDFLFFHQIWYLLFSTCVHRFQGTEHGGQTWSITPSFSQNLVYWKRSTIALLLPLIGSETCCCFQANGSLEHCCIVTNQMKWSPPTKMSISMHELYQLLKKHREDKNRKLISELTP